MPRLNQSQTPLIIRKQRHGAFKSLSCQAHKRNARDGEALRNSKDDQQKPIKPLFCTQVLCVFLPTLCSCDYTCKYLVGRKLKEQKPFCTAGAANKMSSK
ncbi:hypothetical protein ATANTOWER_012907 [Ataeniobius toweri]|uniref:Uncharacterized protein n=1 Tax=Ataeniobius toweri TaxID=208326 RepID=A0ABU7BUH3_9TELE|nr:hypothetical protein [Ataeniobius toweri]